MTAFRPASPRFAALALAFSVTVAMLSSVSALSIQEYRQALLAQAAAASQVAQQADGAARHA
jgi:hypothetical protein